MLLVTSASGEVEAGYEPDAYGNLAFATDKNGTPLATRPDIFHTGKDFDDTTGLYYFNARWYDPETGRFLSRAGIRSDKEHAYLLVESNPISMVDPNGFAPLVPPPPGRPLVPGLINRGGYPEPWHPTKPLCSGTDLDRANKDVACCAKKCSAPGVPSCGQAAIDQCDCMKNCLSSSSSAKKCAELRVSSHYFVHLPLLPGWGAVHAQCQYMVNGGYDFGGNSLGIEGSTDSTFRPLPHNGGCYNPPVPVLF